MTGASAHEIGLAGARTASALMTPAHNSCKARGRGPTTDRNPRLRDLASTSLQEL